MSRIESALNRKRAEQEEAPGVGVVPEGTPEAELFIGPWEVGVDPEPANASPEAAAVKPAPTQAATASEPATSTGTEIATRIPQPAVPSKLAGTVTVLTGHGARFREDTIERLVSSTGLEAAALEQYRRLAAKLHQAQVDRQLNAVMVVSAVPSEGKTLTSLNLALTLSRSYKRRVLLIDADLRRPSLHEVCGLHVDRGLQESVLAPSPNGELAAAFELTPGLALLPAGRPTNDPLGVLTSSRLHAILAEARRAFDWVIVDTAPMAALTDAAMLKDSVDGAILVVSAGNTPFDLVERAVQTLGREHILGVVLNGVNTKEIDAAYGYAEYYGRVK